MPVSRQVRRQSRRCVQSSRRSHGPRVVGIVEPSLWRPEIERAWRKRPESLDAYDLYLGALPYTATQMPEEAAAGLLERAVKLDPYHAPAHTLLAWSHERLFARGGSDEFHREASLDHARAVISGAGDASALAIAGFVLFLLSGDRDGALAAADRALTINPFSASTLYLTAQSNAFTAVQASRAFRATCAPARPFRLSRLRGSPCSGHRGLAGRRIRRRSLTLCGVCTKQPEGQLEPFPSG